MTFLFGLLLFLAGIYVGGLIVFILWLSNGDDALAEYDYPDPNMIMVLLLIVWPITIVILWIKYVEEKRNG